MSAHFMRHLAALLCACALAAGCGGSGPGEPVAEAPPVTGGNDPPQEAACSVAGQRQSLATYMQDNYYWTTQPGDAGAPTLDAYFQSLLMRPPDRYSFSESTAAHDLLLILGKRVGYGYTLVWSDAAQTTLKVRNVEPQSPVARAGLMRGDTILGIDGNPPERVAAGLPGAVTATGVVREFLVRSPAGQQRRMSVASEEFALSAVPATATFDVARQTSAGTETVKVGYFAYQQFVTYGFIDLGDAVRAMSSAGVTELVLDLRYNGGGSVNNSRDLASMIGGTLTAGRVFADLRFNNRHPQSNLSLRFATVAGALPAPPLQGLQRVFVIASGATASASELLVNGLRPFMPVVLIGETTYGKPYGFVPREICSINYNAVNFETFNANGAGNFTSGFNPDCSVPDDLDRQLGDPLEARTRAALFYIVNGRCESSAPQSQALRPRIQPQAIGESTPSRMFID
ncbi:MAG: S41 family peptidase [Ramlibacter sp.]